MNRPNSHVDLQSAAKQAMIENGFHPDFPPEVQQQLASLETQPPPTAAGNGIRDLTSLFWSSIDNDTSTDHDQIEYAERLPNGDARVLVGIADVDVFVAQNTAIDRHASQEATTVY